MYCGERERGFPSRIQKIIKKGLIKKKFWLNNWKNIIKKKKLKKNIRNYNIGIKNSAIPGKKKQID